MTSTTTTKTETIEGTVAEYVTAVIGGQLFGLPISRDQGRGQADDRRACRMRPRMSAACSTCAAVILAVVDMRARLGLDKNDDGKPPMAVGVDLRGESYGLLIDQIGEVLRLPDDDEAVDLGSSLGARRPAGVHRLDGQLHGRPRRRSRPRNRAARP